MIGENNIPKHWGRTKASEVGKLLRGVNYKKEESSSEAKKDYLPVLRGNNINGELNFDDLVYVQSKNISQEQLIKSGDIIFAMSSGSKHLVGKSARAKTNFNGSFGAFCGMFRPNENFNKDFVAYFFQSPYYKKVISEISKGTNINNLKREHILDLDFPIPPIPEQQAIVSKIEELLSDLENGKQQLLLAQQQLKVYRQSLLKWAFEGKLTNQDVEDGELPKGWKWVKFGELFKNTPQNGLYKPSTEYGSGTPILRIDGFYDGIILSNYSYKRVRLTEEETQKYLLSIDDIVVNRVNSMSHLGKCGLVKTLKEQTVFESNVMKIQIKKEIVFPKYITYYLACSKGIKELVKNAKHAVNQASINQTDVANAIIPLGPLEEQQLIVDELESKLTVCDKIEETIRQSLLQAETLKQSILKKAFEGKLVR